MKTLLLIDGNAIMHRAFFALPPFETSKGIPTNMIYGFFTMIHKAISDFQPTHVAIAFDTPKPTFRKKLLKTYQAHRPKVKDEFIQQISYLRELIDLSGLIRLEKEGYEADDVIGTLATHCAKKDTRVFILTGDRDILQLVNEKVFVITPLVGLSKIAIYNEEEVKKKFDIKPGQIPDLKALIGDPSDNYTGAKGIGPKTAATLLHQFDTVEEVLKQVDEISSEKVKNLIKEHKENITLSKVLATIVCDVKLDFDLEKTLFRGFNENMRPLMEELELYSLQNRLFTRAKVAKEKDPKQEKPKAKTSPDQIDLFS